MKVEELRVGNWVATDSGVPERVGKIVGFDGMVMFESGFDYFPVESLRPLRFSVGLLKEIGFDVDDDHAGMSLESDDGHYFELTECHGGYAQSVNSNEYTVSRPFNAVHTLQNLLDFYGFEDRISEEMVNKYTYLLEK